MKILVTTSSFIDTPGKHIDLLNSMGIEYDIIRGPLSEDTIIKLVPNYEAILCGDDEYTEKVLKKGYAGKLRVLAKYGIGLDKIDIVAAKKIGVSVSNTPGVNHTTVAEHTFTHILAFYRNYAIEVSKVKLGEWKRLTGHELYEKRIAIFGLGRIGKEVAIRAKAFEMVVYAFDPFPDHEFIKTHNLVYKDNLDSLFNDADIITLHSPLTNSTLHTFNKKRFESLNNCPLLINTARANLVDKEALIYALNNKLISGYAADVMWDEPIKKDEMLNQYDNVFITPHIGSRTFESVQRQGIAAVKNLLSQINTLQK